MRIAIPTQDQAFGSHFGKSNGLFLCEFDPQSGEVQQQRHISRQANGCESLPGWLLELAVDLVLAGGMGAGAQSNLDRIGIKYSIGHTGETAEEVLAQFLENPKAERENPCHGHEHDHHHCKH
jgi:predicted Fe-Mo cluster-binding NifX family protein